MDRRGLQQTGQAEEKAQRASRETEMLQMIMEGNRAAPGAAELPEHLQLHSERAAAQAMTHRGTERHLCLQHTQARAPTGSPPHHQHNSPPIVLPHHQGSLGAASVDPSPPLLTLLRLRLLVLMTVTPAGASPTRDGPTAPRGSIDSLFRAGGGWKGGVSGRDTTERGH